jgi:hypothetical protein
VFFFTAFYSFVEILGDIIWFLKNCICINLFFKMSGMRSAVVCMLLGLLVSAGIHSQKKLPLIVGVGNYPEGGPVENPFLK